MSPAYFELLSVRIGSRLARSSRSSASDGSYGMASIMVPGAEKRHGLIWFWSEDLIVMDRAYAYARTLPGIVVRDEGGIFQID